MFARQDEKPPEAYLTDHLPIILIGNFWGGAPGQKRERRRALGSRSASRVTAARESGEMNCTEQEQPCFLPTTVSYVILEFEPAEVAQIAQTTKGVLYLLGRVERFLGKALEQAHDLLVRAVLLGKLYELGFADRIGHTV